MWRHDICAPSTLFGKGRLNCMRKCIYQIPSREKKVPLPGFESDQAHYLQTTWKVLIGENCIIQLKVKIKIRPDHFSSFVPFCMPISKLLSEVLHRAPNIYCLFNYIFIYIFIFFYLVCNLFTSIDYILKILRIKQNL